MQSKEELKITLIGLLNNNRFSVYQMNEMVEMVEESTTKNTDPLVEQYNRNRLENDWVESREEIPYIFERNPDSNKVYRRRSGDVHANREVVSVGLGERVYSEEKDVDTLQKEMEQKTGADFMTWFHKLTKNEQSKIAAQYND